MDGKGRVGRQDRSGKTSKEATVVIQGEKEAGRGSEEGGTAWGSGQIWDIF